jgi:YHS domain-containing protein
MATGGTVQERTMTDPVCGLEVNPSEARYKSTYEGRTYYFTDPDCKRMFDEDPEAYIDEGSTLGEPASSTQKGQPM